MKVLLLAPQPYYQERGTPIAIRLLVEDLSRRGWDIDILTFHEGADVSLPNVRIVRIPRLRWVRNVQPGLTVKKLVCDVFLFGKALSMVRRSRYDYVHAVEESVFMALFIRLVSGVPYVFDMDSCLAAQVVEKYRAFAAVAPIMRWIEALAIRHATVVLAVCDALADVARRARARQILILRDAPLGGPPAAGSAGPARDPADAGKTVFTYIGNLQKYQGIDLLLQSFAKAVAKAPDSVLVVVGGAAADIEAYRALCLRAGISGHVRFLGPQPVSRINEFMAAADILVSPRTKGANTPMKLYSYLQAGKAILATDIASHTQVLSPEVAMLARPEPDSFGAAMAQLAADPVLCAQLGQKAAALAREKYSPAAFHAAVDDFCRAIQAGLNRRSAT